MKTSVLEFKLLDDIFCFNTQNVEYVFELESYEEVAGLHKSIVGITKYNNDVMLLIDTAKLYSDKTLDLSREKSVVVIKDEEGMFYGMLVDEITKLEEIESVKLSVDLNTEDMVVNHYKDRDADEIVSEIHPLPLFKKYDIPAMSSHTLTQIKNKSKNLTTDAQSYLLFRVNEHSYAISSKYVKEVLERDAKLFELPQKLPHIKGAMPLRDEVIPVAQIEVSQKSSDVLVVEVGKRKIGIEVDDVYDIEYFTLSQIEPMVQNDTGISAFYNHNSEVIAIIDPAFYIENTQEIEDEIEKTHMQEVAQSKKYDYLIFFIAGKKFAIDMGSVRQVVETDTLQKTHSSSIVASDHVEFISTWNHKAVNIITLEKELGLQAKEDDTQSIFIEYDGHVVAFIVHEVDNIVYLNEEDITSSASQKENLVNGAIMHNDEVIVKFNEKYICSLG